MSSICIAGLRSEEKNKTEHHGETNSKVTLRNENTLMLGSRRAFLFYGTDNRQIK